MNLQHLRAFFWLHWRLRVNQLQRGGVANQVILALLAGSLVLLALSLFVGSFLLGYFLHDASPSVMLFMWDGLVVAFLLSWCVGLLTELQRSEALSLAKFLHLPVSLAGVFGLNYLASLLSVSLILYVPATVGFILGLVFSSGPLMLLLLPLLVAFVFMVTSVSYQFQGWLASLMVDKRRRRTIIAVVTLVFVLLCQLPQLINFMRPWEGQKGLGGDHGRQTLREIEEIAWYVNVAVPPGWLPLGAKGAAEGNPLPALLGTLGLTLMGAVCLRRAYQTTLRLYTGHYTAGTKQPSPAAPPVTRDPAPTETANRPEGMIATNLPWLSEEASVIALASFRSLTRAPEAKMLLLTPIFMVVIFGGMFWRGAIDFPSMSLPLFAFGAIAMVLLTLIQLVGNQFGFDRSGFRIFVLSPAPRREILLGKNLSVAPVALVLAAPMLLVLQVLYPMRVDHLLAVVPQFVSMYLLFCMVANFLSILAPTAVAAGSLKPANTNWVTVMLQMLFMSFFPVAMAPTLIPLGIEFMLEWLEWSQGVPICLILSLAECAAVIYVYRLVLTWQGSLLQSFEQRILNTVTTKAE